MKKLCLALLTAVSLNATPSLAQSQATIDEVNSNLKQGIDLMVQADKQPGPAGKGYHPGLLMRSHSFFKKAYELLPEDKVVIDWYASSLYYLGSTFRLYQGSASSAPKLELKACPLLRKSASLGGALSKEILSSFWKDCANYGDRLYLADDNIIRIRGTGGDNPSPVTPGGISPVVEYNKERQKCLAEGRCEMFTPQESPRQRAWRACDKIYRTSAICGSYPLF